MPREHPDYRNTIEQLNRLFPDRELLTVPEVKQVTGWKSVNTIKKKFPAFHDGKINKATLARMLCYGGK